MEYWFVLPVGVVIATLVSAIGIGGGILWMPFFLIVLQLKPENAVLTSLLIQTAGMGSASFAFFRQHKIDLRLMRHLIVLAMPGVLIGAAITTQIKSNTMQLILGILVMMSAFLFVSSTQKYNDVGKLKAKLDKVYQHLWITFPASISSGMLSTSMNEWLIPIMQSKLDLRMSAAIANSIAITFIVCLLGATIHLIIGSHANFAIILWAIPGVLIGGQIGPRITNRINERLLKEVFIFFLTLTGVHLIYNSY